MHAENLYSTTSRHKMDRHVGQYTELHPHASNGFKGSHQLVLPPIAQRFIRNQPQSGFDGDSILDNGSILFDLYSVGFTEKLALELSLTVSNNPVSILGQFLIDRVELMTSNNDILQTIFGMNVYLDKIHQTKEYHDRVRDYENISEDFDALAIPVGTKRLLLHIPTWIDGSHPKLNSIRDELKLKVYFSRNGVTAGLLSDIRVDNIDMIQKVSVLDGKSESMEIQKKSSIKQSFRVLNPVQFAYNNLTMNPSSQYDIKLSGSSGSLCSYLIFTVRRQTDPISEFSQLDSYELVDAKGSIFAIRINNELNKEFSLAFQGEIFNEKNIYAWPFSIDVESARQGSQTGFFSFSGDERLRLYTPSTWTAGDYTIQVFGYEYAEIVIDKGHLSIKR